MKVFLKTYGCRANQYDTEAVRSMLASAGVEEASGLADADAAVFNTCTVTAAAEAELRSDVRNAARLNPRLRAIVMGCAAAVPDRNEAVAPLATLPGVHSVVPGADIAGIALALDLDPSLVAPGARTQSGARALLRIQDGCDEHCTFCATTISRGANRSRAIGDIVHEATALAEAHPEIVLTGIHIGTYGLDIGESLSRLVERLIRDVPRVRFRLTSVEATEVDERLAEMLVGDSSRLAPHLHAPLQSGSDAVLRRMGRHWYTAGSYAESVERIFGSATCFALAADVISGFPGETDLDHRETVRLIERLPFTSLHVFPYSPRPGTAALRLRGGVSGTVARARAAELRALSDAKAAAHVRSRLGGQCDVVVTERGKGLTEDYLSAAIPDSSVPRRGRFQGVLQSGNGRLDAIPTSVTHV
jgi:threonylcarbamoyladenosine tRNA methylthiotransferase MtaB